MNNLEKEAKELREKAQELLKKANELEEKLNFKFKQPQEWRAHPHHNWVVLDTGKVGCPLVHDEDRAQHGTTFATRERAQTASDMMQIHNKLIQWKMDHEPFWKPDWDDSNQLKYRVFFDHFRQEFARVATVFSEEIGVTPFSDEMSKKLVDDLNARLLPDFNHYFRD